MEKRDIQVLRIIEFWGRLRYLLVGWETRFIVSSRGTVLDRGEDHRCDPPEPRWTEPHRPYREFRA